jgi:hypothetical protein
MKVARLSALRTGPLCPQEIILVLISVRGWVDPRAIVQSEGLCRWKFPITPSWIDPATFRFCSAVPQPLRHCVSQFSRWANENPLRRDKPGVAYSVVLLLMFLTLKRTVHFYCVAIPLLYHTVQMRHVCCLGERFCTLRWYKFASSVTDRRVTNVSTSRSNFSLQRCKQVTVAGRRILLFWSQSVLGSFVTKW